MRFHFNDARTAQAAALLLKLNGGPMPYMVLIKLLYMADRQMLLAHGRPITGDRLISMRHGPVLSRVLDFINHGPKKEPDTVWFSLINQPSGYDITAKDGEAPTDELSPYEMDLLKAVHEKYGALGNSDRWALVDLLHKALPEWRDPGDSALRIEYADILRADDRSEDEIEMIKDEAASVWLLSSL